MRKAVIGGILLVVGILLAVAGALTAFTFGPSGTLRTTSTPLETTPEGYALVADVVAVSAGFPGSSLLGTPTLGADSSGNERLFVGIGSRTDVDEYLAGAPFQAVRQDGNQWESLSIPGTKNPGLPSEEQFWFERATGNAPSVDFSTSTGSATFVVMHADGTPDVRAQILIGYTSRWVFPLSIAAVVLGLLAAIVGIVLLRRSRRSDEDRSEDGDEGPPQAATQAAAAAPWTTPRPHSYPSPNPTPNPSPTASADMPEDWFRQPGDKS